jgi:excisionase family DNA binding protein
MTPNETALLLNRKAVSKLLSLSERSVDFLLADGRLTPVKFGNRVLVSRAQVESLAVTGIEGRIRPC